jgi:asparagine synthase (glutamine-hydrolysing)
MVAETYHMIHSNFYVNSKQYAEGLIEAIRTNEEPLNHPGHVGRVLFDSHTKDKVDALLMGEGVDTMFCGAKAYPLLKYGYMFNPFRKLTRRIFSLIDPEIIPDSHKRYYTKIRDAFVMNADEYMIRTFAAAEFQEASDLLELEADMSYLNYYKSFISECTRENVLEKYLMLNQHTFIVEVLNSDAKYRELNQIINYYPFLDVELLSFSNHIPFKIRTKGFTGKYLIKKLAERYFSKHFIYQQKEGFGVPLKTYFQDPESMGRYFDLLLEKRTMERGIFKRRELSNFVEGFRKGEMPSESYESLLWTAINLELWYRIFIDRNGV